MENSIIRSLITDNMNIQRKYSMVRLIAVEEWRYDTFEAQQTCITKLFEFCGLTENFAQSLW